MKHSVETINQISKNRKETWEKQKEEGYIPKHKRIPVTEKMLENKDIQFKYLSKFSKDGDTAYIYGLYDPETLELKYVGKANNMLKRYKEHLREYMYYWSRKTCWMVNLLNRDLVPIMDLIDICDFTNWDEKEKYWISHYKDSGVDLLNGTSGGDNCFNMNQEVKDKISKANSGENHPNWGKKFSDETKQNISRARKGFKVAPEVAKKIGNALRGRKLPPRNPEHSRKCSEALTNNPKIIKVAKDSWANPEIRAKRIAGMKETARRNKKKKALQKEEDAKALAAFESQILIENPSTIKS